MTDDVEETGSVLWLVCPGCGCVVADEAKHENNCAGNGGEELS